MLGLIGKSRPFVSVRRYTTSVTKQTLFDKIWKSHIVRQQDDGTCLLYIDRHLVHEVTSPQAFEGLRQTGRKVRRPEFTLAVADHNVPTTHRSQGILDEESRIQVETLESNCKHFGVPYIGMNDVRQGIVHIIGPEQGFTQPGMTIVCGDSHTSTHGAFGALAFGIGTSEVEHVLATQTLLQRHAKNMRILVKGDLPIGVTSKDLVLNIISTIGTAGGTGHVIEYTGKVISQLSMESRMTICNMSIEAGARAGMIAPDEVTFNYLKGRPMSPKGENWTKALAYWKTLSTDEGALFDKEVVVHASDIAPQVTWGTSPQDVVPVTGTVPDPAAEPNQARAKSLLRSLEYMGLKPGQKISEITIDKVFIGSCTNGRIEDLRAVVDVVRGKKVAHGVHAMVVPGSGIIKKQAEEEGLHKILLQSGFEWREPGCSMCLAMNADRLLPGERCASTSNRNFEGRQGSGGRTHLVSPAMAAAAAVTGRFTDVRTFARGYCTYAGSRRGYSTLAAETNPIQFTKLKGIAAPMDMINIDTDKIIPKQFLKTIKRTGLGKNLFQELRYSPEGKENPTFILNREPYRKAKILVAGENFGCGSSREHAPWAIGDFGIRCIISMSYADIFYNNCFKNGILPVRLGKEQVEVLMEDAKGPDPELEVDLERQVVRRRNGKEMHFEVDSFQKYCLLNGLDEIGLTMQHEKMIGEYETKRAPLMPWL